MIILKFFSLQFWQELENNKIFHTISFLFFYHVDSYIVDWCQHVCAEGRRCHLHLLKFFGWGSLDQIYGSVGAISPLGESN